MSQNSYLVIMNRIQKVLQDPKLAEGLEVIKTGISEHRTIIIVGECKVNYDGRANSKLESGERVVLLKSDGSALVHRYRDYQPVNWQPPGSFFRSTIHQNELIIRIYQQKNDEKMIITFIKLNMVSSFNMRDTGEFHLYASEQDMQQAIILEPNLLEKGFRPITKEHSVYPGFIDILGKDKDGTLTIVEIKRVKANRNAVLQLKKYMDAIDFDKERKVRAILVAPEIGKNVAELLASFNYEYKVLKPQECSQILKKYNEGSLIKYLK